jgi:hypothetical protein
VNYAIHLPMSHFYGLGDTWSADDMRFYVIDMLAADFSHLLHGRGVTLYAHTGETQCAWHQEPIPCRLREATFVLDRIIRRSKWQTSVLRAADLVAECLCFGSPRWTRAGQVAPVGGARQRCQQRGAAADVRGDPLAWLAAGPLPGIARPASHA